MSNLHPLPRNAVISSPDRQARLVHQTCPDGNASALIPILLDGVPVEAEYGPHLSAIGDRVLLVWADTEYFSAVLARS